MVLVVERRNDVDLDCRTAVRKHSNTVKQWERLRAAQCEAIRLDQLMAATQRIRMSSVLELGMAVAQKIERRHPAFLAVPAARAVGLGTCSVAAARATSFRPRGRTDGRAASQPAYGNVRKTA